MRLENVVVDARDPLALARWWAEALGAVVTEEGDEVWVNLAGRTPASGPWPDLVFEPGDDLGAGRRRVHLDLSGGDAPDDQAATVARLEALGATRADVGQPADAPWVVLADPEGHPFCVLPPGTGGPAAGALAEVVVACAAVEAVLPVWRAATGWPVVDEEPGLARLRRPDGTGPDLALVARPDLAAGAAAHDTGKDRIHLDVRPEAGEDRDEVVAALLALGARPLDVGQGEVPWVVLADPEGTALCVLAPG